MNAGRVLLGAMPLEESAISRLGTPAAPPPEGFDATLEEAVREHEPETDDDEMPVEPAPAAWVPTPFVAPPLPPPSVRIALPLAGAEDRPEAAPAIAASSVPETHVHPSPSRPRVAREAIAMRDDDVVEVERPAPEAVVAPREEAEVEVRREAREGEAPPASPRATRVTPRTEARAAPAALPPVEAPAAKAPAVEARRGEGPPIASPPVHRSAPDEPPARVPPRPRAGPADAPVEAVTVAPAPPAAAPPVVRAAVEPVAQARPLAPHHVVPGAVPPRIELAEDDALPPLELTPASPRATVPEAHAESSPAPRRADPPAPLTTPLAAPRETPTFALADERASFTPAPRRSEAVAQAAAPAQPAPPAPRAAVARPSRVAYASVADAVDDRGRVEPAPVARDVVDETVGAAPLGGPEPVFAGVPVVAPVDAPTGSATSEPAAVNGAHVMRGRTREAVLTAARENGDVHALRRGGRASVDLGEAGHLAVEATVHAERTEVVVRAERDATARVLSEHGDELARELRDVARVTVTSPTTRARFEADAPPDRQPQGDRPANDAPARDAGREASTSSGGSGRQHDEGRARTAADHAARGAAAPVRRGRATDTSDVGAPTDRQPIVAGRRVRIVL